MSDTNISKSHPRPTRQEADMILRALVEEAPEAIVVVDADTGHFVQANKRAAQLYGLSHEALLQTGPAQLSPPVQPGGQDSHTLALQYIEAAAAGATPVFEWRHLRADGAEIPCEIRLSRFPVGPGRLVRATIADISEHKRMEEGSRRLQTIVEAAPDLVGMADGDGYTLYINPAGRRLLGYGDQEDLTGLSISAYHPPEANARIQAEMMPVAVETGVWRGENTLLARDGRKIPVSQIVIAHKTVTGELVYFSTIARDMTERKKAETALRKERDFTAAVLETVGAVVVVMDAEGRIVSFNEASECLTGYSFEEVKGKFVWDMFLAPEEIEPVKAVFGRLTAGQFPGTFENYWLTREGEKRLIAWSNTALLSDEGAVEYVIATGIDITISRQAQEELNAYRDHLEELVEARTMELKAVNKELEAFSYSVSHDLRAPLRSINGFSKVLLEDYGRTLEPQAQDYLQRIAHAGERMGELIDDLLTLSRITRLEMRRERVDLSGMTEEIIGGLQTNQPRQSVTVSIAPGLSAIGDMRLLRVLLENLLNNAWKFTSLRQQARIEFGAREEEGQAIYYVRDNGAGFDMAYADKLFGAFQRMHTAQEFEGTGVGLATAQRIVHRHGGRIWAEAAVDKGAAFFFTLASEASADRKAGAESESRQGGSSLH